MEYARVYKHNHFLRGGMRGGVQGINIGDDRKFTFQPSPEFWWGYIPPDTVLFLTNTSQNIGRYWGGGFVGYEYGMGKNNLRFTFGADLHLGYRFVDVRTAQNKYRLEHTYDGTSELFHYDIQFLGYGNRRETLHALFTGIFPRLGLRKDLNERFAIAFTFNRMLGYYWSPSRNETISGTAPDYSNHPKKRGLAAFQAECAL